MGKSDRTETNRRNAAKSTGPKTELGKARSALNRASHGLRSEVQVIPGESAEDFRAFVAGIALELKAEGEAESAAANLIASCLWRLGRVPRYLAGAAAEEMSDYQLEEKLDDEAAFSELPEIFAGKAVAGSETIEKLREDVEDLQLAVDCLESQLELVTKIDDPKIQADRWPSLYAEDFAPLAGSPDTMVKALLAEKPNECTAAELRAIIEAGTNGIEPIVKDLRLKLLGQGGELAMKREWLEKIEARRQAAKQALAEKHVIPNESVMKRVAAFESQTTRTLARLMETFQGLRAMRTESSPKRPRIAVASIAKKAENRKSVQT